jgi:hypothetical protein
MHPHATGFDNPQSTGKGMGVQIRQHCSESGEQRFQRRPASEFEYNNAGACYVGETEGLGKNRNPR